MNNRLVLALIGILGLMIGLVRTGSANSISAFLSVIVVVSALLSTSKTDEDGWLNFVKAGILFLTFLWVGVAVTTILAKNFCN